MDKADKLALRGQPRLLDLFCCAGGAAVGYARAGFEVTGMDIAPQPNYPFEFVQMDVMELLENPCGLFNYADFLHASPPCQGYIGWQNITVARGGTNDWPKLIEPVREAFQLSGLPWIIENVENAPLRPDRVLCGTMFGLGVRRHRKFETSFAGFDAAPTHNHTGLEMGVYGKLDGRRLGTRADGSELRAAKTLKQAREVMGIDWMTWDELREAIPPSYTEWLGRQYLKNDVVPRVSHEQMELLA